MLAPEELDGGGGVLAEQPHDKPLLRHLQVCEAVRDCEVPGCLQDPD